MEKIKKLKKNKTDVNNYSLPSSPKGTSVNMIRGPKYSRSIYFDSNYDHNNFMRANINISHSDDAIFHDFVDPQQSLFVKTSRFKYLQPNILPGACPHHMDSDGKFTVSTFVDIN